MNNLKVRRSSYIYFAHIALMVFLYWKAYHLNANREFLIEVLWKVIYFPAAIVYLLRISFWPYIETKNGKLFIHHDYLMSDSFGLSRLEKIEMSSSPFKDSYFVLDNYVRYEFKYFDVSDASFNKLISELDRPVIDI